MFLLTFLLGVFLSPSTPVLRIPPVLTPSAGISEITLKRHGCYGGCPVYEVTLRSDGTASYTGHRFVDRIGTYRAKYQFQFNFDQIASWMERKGFFELADEYEIGLVDAEVVTTSAVRDSIRKSVTTYNSLEPAKLWEINTVIDGVASRIQWEQDLSE